MFEIGEKNSFTLFSFCSFVDVMYALDNSVLLMRGGVIDYRGRTYIFAIAAVQLVTQTNGRIVNLQKPPPRRNIR